jgi:signal transduction histidine kinase/ActR/RegA family two-component response regulator
MNHDELKERYEVLKEFVQLISSGVNLERISRTVVNQAAFRFGADIVLLFTGSLEDEVIDIKGTYGVRKGELPESIPLEDSPLERAFRFGGTISIPNLEQQSDEALGFLQELGIRSVHLSTLEGREGNLGALLLAFREEQILNQFDAAMLDEFTQGATAAVSAALSQAKLSSYAERLEELVHKRTEDLNQQKTQAEESNRAKGRFVANMSHELRTPLTAIVGYSSVLASGVFGPVNDKQRDALISIQRSSEHLKELIDEVLNLSRIEAGKEEPEPSKVELFSLLQQVQKLMLQTAVGKGIEMKPILVGEEDKLKKLWVDPRHIRQILLNLVSNAVKYTPSGGTVQLSANCSGDTVTITVTDTGVGLSEDEQKRLFSRFERGDDSYSREQTGTGLGLSLTKTLVERNGGKIGVRSRKGEGSEFFITMPLAEGGSAVTSYEDRSESETRIIDRLEGLSLLVLEDNPTTAEVLESILSRAGATVHLYSRTKEAVKGLERGDIDLCLVDLAIPGESGLSFIETARREGSKLPIIVVSACVFEQDREQALLSGANSFVAKPFSPGELVESIRELTIQTAIGSTGRYPAVSARLA